MGSCIGVLLLAVATLNAQGPPPLADFEVASIKPNVSGAFAVSMLPAPDGVNFVNMTVRQLILRAYQIQDFQLSGGPDWINAERFDVQARRPANAPASQNPIMLRRLLADRFKLTVRQEMHERPVFALVFARADRRLGPRLQKASVDCQQVVAAAVKAGAGPGAEPRVNGGLGCATSIRPGEVAAGGTPLSRFATMLSGLVNQIVVDRTGLTGTYDIELSWTAEPLRDPAPGVALPPVADDGSIFTAVQEQLGLRLEPQRGPVDVLVIERIERPVPN